MIYLEMLNTEEERQHFSELYEKYHKDMYFCAYQILKSHAAAEDAVHMSFLKLIERFERYRDLPIENWRALCIIVARNTALDYWRKDDNIELTEEEEVFDYQSTKGNSFQQNPQLDLMLAEEAKGILKEALKKLPERGKIVITLYYMEQLSSREIGKLLGMNEKHVNIELYRTRDKLKKILEKEGYFDVKKTNNKIRNSFERNN